MPPCQDVKFYFFFSFKDLKRILYNLSIDLKRMSSKTDFLTIVFYFYFSGFGRSQGLPKRPIDIQGWATRAPADLTARSSAPSWVCGLALPTRAPPSFPTCSWLYFVVGSPTAPHAATTDLFLIQEFTQALRDTPTAASSAPWLSGSVLLVEERSSNPSVEK